MSLSGIVLAIFVIGIALKMYLESDAFNLKCIVSNVDGNKYCVRERAKLQMAADLLAEAKAAAAAKEVDPTFIREGEVLDTQALNEATRLGNETRSIENALKIAQDTARNNYQTLQNQYEMNRALLQQRIAEATGKQQYGLAELDLRRQMEENKMQQFREEQKFNQEERREKRIQMIMQVLDGLTRRY